MVSRADAAACPVKPGKKEANALLKTCRFAIPYGNEHVGQIVHLKDAGPEFCWQGWLAGQSQADDIFQSGAGQVCVINCFVEAFPEREPNSRKLPKDQSHLRVDIVRERSDGSAIRLHPSKTGKDARIRTGFLSRWRVGIKEKDNNLAIPVEHDAVKIARDRALLLPAHGTVIQVTSGPVEHSQEVISQPTPSGVNALHEDEVYARSVQNDREYIAQLTNALDSLWQRPALPAGGPPPAGAARAPPPQCA